MTLLIHEFSIHSTTIAGSCLEHLLKTLQHAPFAEVGLQKCIYFNRVPKMLNSYISTGLQYWFFCYAIEPILHIRISVW